MALPYSTHEFELPYWREVLVAFHGIGSKGAAENFIFGAELLQLLVRVALIFKKAGHFGVLGIVH